MQFPYSVQTCMIYSKYTMLAHYIINNGISADLAYCRYTTTADLQTYT